jgi:predicted nucleic-acid-binding protein
MRGVDTNVLLRFITFDDPEQSPAAQRFIEGSEDEGERLFIAVVALCELAWTLRGPGYRYDRHSIAAVVERLLEMPLLEIETRDVVVRALSAYREGTADFADFVIGEAGARRGCSDTVTLDRRLARLDGYTLVT